MLDIAHEHIFDLYKHPRFSGTLEHASFSEDGANPFCGDEVHFDVLIEGGVTTKIRHTCRACAICTASADLLAEHLENKPLKELDSLGNETIKEWLGIPLSPLRLKCALLPLETLRQAKKDL